MSGKQQIMDLIQKRQWATAKVACLDFCQANPNDPETWFWMAGIHAQLGEFDRVIAACRHVLALQPENVAAYYNLGVALQSQGNDSEAAAAYRELLLINPQHAVALANLGLVQRVLGQIADGIASCRQAIQIKPDMVEAHNTLGLLFKDESRHEEAAASFLQALKLRPDFAEAQFNLGLCHEAQGRLEEAVSCYRRAAECKPGYADAHARAGKLLDSLNRPKESALHYRQAVEAKPDWVEVWNSLGNALLDANQSRADFLEAEKCYKQALALQPDVPEVYLNMAVMYQDAAKYDEAQVHYQRALELKPGYPDALAGMAKLMEFKGEFQAGYELIRPLLENEANNLHVAMAYAALSKHIDQRADAVAMLERCLQQPVDRSLRIKAYFELGKLYDSLKEFDKAFDSFHQGNSLDVKPFDTLQNEQEFNEIMQVFSAENMAHRPRASNRSRLPVFIVGMPRSGTSLVEQILASHPEVYGAGELDDIHQLTVTLPGEANSPLPYPKCMDALPRKKLDMVAQRHLERLAGFSRNATRVTDKMPHNFRALGLIDTLFPGARIIHCKRDPIDTCLSIFFLRFNEAHGYARELADLGVHIIGTT